MIIGDMLRNDWNRSKKSKRALEPRLKSLAMRSMMLGKNSRKHRARFFKRSNISVMLGKIFNVCKRTLPTSKQYIVSSNSASGKIKMQCLNSAFSNHALMKPDYMLLPRGNLSHMQTLRVFCLTHDPIAFLKVVC